MIGLTDDFKNREISILVTLGLQQFTHTWQRANGFTGIGRCALVRYVSFFFIKKLLNETIRLSGNSLAQIFFVSMNKGEIVAISHAGLCDAHLRHGEGGTELNWTATGTDQNNVLKCCMHVK